MAKPEKPKDARKRGRPTDRLVVPPENAGAILDGWLGKKPKAEAPAEAPKVRSKKKRAP